MNAVLWIPSGAAVMAGVLDRPFIQHVVEQLVERGIRQISLLLSKENSAAASFVGNGERWGVSICAREVESQPSVQDFTNACKAEPDALVLFGNVSRLCHLPHCDSNTASWSTLFFDEEDGVGAWSGWAVIKSAVLAEFAGRVAVGVEWRTATRELAITAKKVFLEHSSLSVSSPRDILLANRRALDGEFPGLFFSGKERQPGVWVARGAKIAGSARLNRPCYIGEDAWVGASCRIGPYATIAPGCVVERGTSVARAVVQENTFLGPELEVSDSYVNHNRIQNIRLDTDIVIGEEHVASSLAPSSIFFPVRQFLGLQKANG